MISKIRLFLTASITSFFAILFYLVPVHATTVSPVLVDVDGNPGEAISGFITIKNNENETRTYYASTQNFIARGEEGRQTFLNEEEGTGLASWIITEVGTFTLGSGDERRVAYTIDIPDSAEPGGHYAALFFSTQPTGEEGGSSVGIGAKIGVLFLARVSGDIREEAVVESFRIANGRVLSRLPAFFELRVRNTGNVHFRPQGDIVITNSLGQEVDRFPVNPKNSAVLPGSIRRIESSWGREEDLEKKGGFFAELRNEWKNFAIGRYTAEVQGVYGKSGQELHVKQTFWVLPLRVMSVIVIGFILLLLGVRGYNRAIVHAALKRHSSE